MKTTETAMTTKTCTGAHKAAVVRRINEKRRQVSYLRADLDAMEILTLADAELHRALNKDLLELERDIADMQDAALRCGCLEQVPGMYYLEAA